MIIALYVTFYSIDLFAINEGSNVQIKKRSLYERNIRYFDLEKHNLLITIYSLVKTINSRILATDRQLSAVVSTGD